jgi:hypothetical protein
MRGLTAPLKLLVGTALATTVAEDPVATVAVALSADSFAGGFTFSTSAITSANGNGMCETGLEFVTRLGSLAGPSAPVGLRDLVSLLSPDRAAISVLAL